MSNLVNYDQFDPAKLFCLTPVSKEIKNKDPSQAGQGKVEYFDFSPLYNYGTEEKPHNDDLYLQLPPVWCWGISEKIVSDTYNKLSTKIVVDLGEPEQAKLVNILNSFDADKPCKSLYQRIVEIVFHYRGVIKKAATMKSVSTTQGNVKELLYYQRNPENGEPIPGKNPSTFVKVNNTSWNKTNFMLPKGESISMDRLKNTKFKCIPLIRLVKITTAGPAINAQFELTSAIILEILKISDNDRQRSTLDSIKDSNAFDVDKLRQQLEALEESPPTISMAPNRSVNNEFSSKSSLTEFLSDTSHSSHQPLQSLPKLPSIQPSEGLMTPPTILQLK